ncbi:DUF11 domain-containing protein, partial [Clostridium botulinum]|nr:DUF11 domain-containing protein [Clostridium botulinum]
MATLPNPNPVPNSGTISYNYQVDPSLPLTSGSNNTNIVSTQINTTDLQMTKSTSLNFANVGDIITYTIALKNAGNVTANNVVFTDTIPNDTTFVTNSVTINGVTQVGTSPAPPTGVSISTIAPNTTTTLVFKVTVNTIPTPNPIPNNSTSVYNYVVDPITNPSGVTGSRNSNQVTTQVNNANIQSTKAVDKTNAKVGDILTYTMVLKNVGNVTANSVVFKDTIPSSTSFVTNSFAINGATQTGISPAPPTGATIGTISPGGVTTLTFKVTVSTIPTINPIPNSGTSTYPYTVDPSTPNGLSGSSNTNIVNTTIIQATIDNQNGGGMVKAVDNKNAQVGDILTYTIGLKNTGNVTADNVVFTDTIPGSTSFVTNSVTLNGVTQTGASPAPPTGINVGNIGPGTATTVVFQVKVTTI